ncbi:hypothetical protein SKAU_G00256840 [Synaphobranchus kaupii]|uniref:Uncharacterized protein n=1 Tax=Synaphobranchus kaupii TaxID=118154 RepID=A0A9Q1IQC0_SYNKA|nr:hypothetical protein SKAU_G00256840 [Synaphobranchus kaupii]
MDSTTDSSTICHDCSVTGMQSLSITSGCRQSGNQLANYKKRWNGPTTGFKPSKNGVHEPALAKVSDGGLELVAGGLEITPNFQGKQEHGSPFLRIRGSMCQPGAAGCGQAIVVLARSSRTRGTAPLAPCSPASG